ncbi:acetolactate synthase [Janibacter sp. Soil728]|uniref:thiamine pyrophosphate-binding protein n=1 Tax=Janibacter sp. Soil728 TaxID=1736393 RepID=UPI0006FD9513|nr:thiamine pyrophosphate-binding protein [Janibacter sp. Soil728]KRE35341.1 acetolactate synthase [Janibacter sp. Soil728]
MTQTSAAPRADSVQQAGPATGGDVLVDVMRRHGITHAFGVISIHNLPLVEAVSRELTFVEVRHEAAAVNAADAFARVTGGVGVALTSTGTGAGNAAGSMLEALTAGSRVLHVTGQVEAEWIGSNRGVIHEVPAQLEMLTAISKGAARVAVAEDSARVLEEAIAMILTAPHGPVSVEWPTDLQYLARPDAQVDGDVVTVPSPPEAPLDEIDAAVALLTGARRPVLWLGGGAAGAGAQVRELAHRLGAGIITSNSGRGVVPEDDDLVIGNFGSTPQGAALLEDADVLLSIGTHFRSNETRTYSLRLPAQHVQVDVAAAAIGRVHPATVGVQGDAAQVVTALLERLTQTATEDGWADRARTVRREVRDHLTGYIGGYAEVCAELRSQLPRESVIARDVTIPSSQWGNRLLEMYARETNVFPLGGGIGQGLAMGIGAAVARPEVPTVVIAGDGGLSVHLGELASLRGTGAACVVIVFNDSGYGVLRNMQQANDMRRAAVDLWTPDFAVLAASMDMPYWLTGAPGTFGPALREAIATGRPTVIEVSVADLAPAPGPFTPPVHIPQPQDGA